MGVSFLIVETETRNYPGLPANQYGEHAAIRMIFFDFYHSLSHAHSLTLLLTLHI